MRFTNPGFRFQAVFRALAMGRGLCVHGPGQSPRWVRPVLFGCMATTHTAQPLQDRPAALLCPKPPPVSTGDGGVRSAGVVRGTRAPRAGRRISPSGILDGIEGGRGKCDGSLHVSRARLRWLNLRWRGTTAHCGAGLPATLGPTSALLDRTSARRNKSWSSHLSRSAAGMGRANPSAS